MKKLALKIIFMGVSYFMITSQTPNNNNQPKVANDKFPKGEFKTVASMPIETPAQKSNEYTYRERTLQEYPTTKEWATTNFPSRFIYLNGVNVSDLSNEVLENVTIKIDESGNIHIFAPHYEVREQTSYHPLLKQELPQFRKQTDNPPARVPKSKDINN